MGFLDIVLGGLLAFALYKGIRNGLFVELASLVSLLAGIYFAIKFSSLIKGILSRICKLESQYDSSDCFYTYFYPSCRWNIIFRKISHRN